MSNPFESSQQINVENEARKTVDSSWDAPFHTLGKGATQAAAGNHNHNEYLTPAEVIAGNNITVNQNSDGSITIHGSNPGDPITNHGALSNRTSADQHSIGSVTGLQTALNGKAASSHTHSDYATSGHNHSGVYATSGHNHSGVYADVSHGHTGYATSGHNHSGVYANVSHGHSYGPYFKYGRPNTAFPISSNQSTGEIVIAHGLGRTPYAVFVSTDDDGGDCSVFASVNRFDATNIYAKMRNIGGDEAHVYINWIAF